MLVAVLAPMKRELKAVVGAIHELPLQNRCSASPYEEGKDQ